MSKKVIIIDDSLTALNLAKTAFATCGWEVYGAQNAHSAIELIYSVAPDLVVTDAIMPVMGGFQLLKTIRNDDKISKIPVIVYSILDESNSKFYIKQEQGEYYLQKSDDLDKITNLAQEVVNKHPLQLDYKFEILKANIEKDSAKNMQMPKTVVREKESVSFDRLESQFKEIYNFSRADDKILQDAFSILYPILGYDLAIVCVDSPKKNDKSAYFDIRDIILSPIFQNNILQKLYAKESFLFKKYAPNLKVITNEEEFLTKVRFNFEYNKKIIANVIFYSKDKSKWIDGSDMEVVKNVLDGFFRARYLNKSINASKNSDLSNKYFIDKFDFKFDSQNKKQMYIAILEISNFKDMQDALSADELDFLNSKISEKLISFIGEDEQIYKNDEDGYNIVLFTKDEAQVNQKLNWIIDLLDEISIHDNKIEVLVGACSCKIDNQFNFYEAQKCAKMALSGANSQNRIVIYDSK